MGTVVNFPTRKTKDQAALSEQDKLQLITSCIATFTLALDYDTPERWLFAYERISGAHNRSFPHMALRVLAEAAQRRWEETSCREEKV